MTAFVRHLHEHGILLVFLAVFLEQAGLPLPSFTVVVAAGALIATGEVQFWAILAAAVAAALLANLAWYGAGLRYGQRVLSLICRISLSADTCVRMTQSIFVRWGLASLLLSKFLPGISLMAPPIAGAVRMPLVRFLVASSAGTLLWGGCYLALGYLFRNQIDQVFAYGHQHLQVVLHVLAVMLLLYIAYRAVQRWLAARGAGVQFIEAAELHRLLGGAHEARPLVLDLRSELVREGEGGIPGAIPIELRDIEGRAARLPFDRDIITYCACPNDISALRAAKALRRQGYVRVAALRGGVEAWSAIAVPAAEAAPVK